MLSGYHFKLTVRKQNGDDLGQKKMTYLHLLKFHLAEIFNIPPRKTGFAKPMKEMPDNLDNYNISIVFFFHLAKSIVFYFFFMGFEKSLYLVEV